MKLLPCWCGNKNIKIQVKKQEDGTYLVRYGCSKHWGKYPNYYYRNYHDPDEETSRKYATADWNRRVQNYHDRMAARKTKHCPKCHKIVYDPWNYCPMCRTKLKT